MAAHTHSPETLFHACTNALDGHFWHGLDSLLHQPGGREAFQRAMHSLDNTGGVRWWKAWRAYLFGNARKRQGWTITVEQAMLEAAGGPFATKSHHAPDLALIDLALSAGDLETLCRFQVLAPQAPWNGAIGARASLHAWIRNFPTDPAPPTMPALHQAVAKHQPDVVDWLLDLGADVNLRDPATGRTPLHAATSLSMAERLLERGANLRLEDQLGLNPIAYWLQARDPKRVSKPEEVFVRSAPRRALAALKREPALASLDIQWQLVARQLQSETPLLAPVRTTLRKLGPLAYSPGPEGQTLLALASARANQRGGLGGGKEFTQHLLRGAPVDFPDAPTATWLALALMAEERDLSEMGALALKWIAPATSDEPRQAPIEEVIAWLEAHPAPVHLRPTLAKLGADVVLTLLEGMDSARTNNHTNSERHVFWGRQAVAQGTRLNPEGKSLLGRWLQWTVAMAEPNLEIISHRFTSARLADVLARHTWLPEDVLEPACQLAAQPGFWGSGFDASPVDLLAASTTPSWEVLEVMYGHTQLPGTLAWAFIAQGCAARLPPRRGIAALDQAWQTLATPENFPLTPWAHHLRQTLTARALTHELPVAQGERRVRL